MNHRDILSKNAVIANELGLHARPAAQIASIAAPARSGLWIISGNEKADAKSVIAILLLACKKGSVITVKAEHRTDAEILNNIVKLIEKDVE